MADSADIADAAKRLQLALDKLEDNVGPLLSKISGLEQAATESQAFTQDRSRLAAELDEIKAQNAEYEKAIQSFAAREAEFKRLAQETTQQLDRVIADVTQALEKDARNG